MWLRKHHDRVSGYAFRHRSIAAAQSTAGIFEAFGRAGRVRSPGGERDRADEYRRRHVRQIADFGRSASGILPPEPRLVIGMVASTLRAPVHAMFLVSILFALGAIGVVDYGVGADRGPMSPLVEIVTRNPGRSAAEIERTITVPIEIRMAGIENVTAVETISLAGRSYVRVRFAEDDPHEPARQKVSNRLPRLANGVQPRISVESPPGEIYRYQVVGPKGYSLTDLETIRNWILDRRFKAVPGVADADGWSCKIKTHQVTVDRKKLLDYDLTLPQVLQQLDDGTMNVGGQSVDIGEESIVIRGVGLFRPIDDLRGTLLTTSNGAPVFLTEIATVDVVFQPSLGAVGTDGEDDIVQGMVVMAAGEDGPPTLRRVEAEVRRLNNSGILPPGVEIRRLGPHDALIGGAEQAGLGELGPE
jgi:heavy metal efflux system protein